MSWMIELLLTVVRLISSSGLQNRIIFYVLDSLHNIQIS